MHFQAPIATENDVSTIVATFYQTPEKPTVDCGVSVASFPFSTAVDVEPAPPMLLPMMLPSKSTAKPAIDCSVPFFLPNSSIDHPLLHSNQPNQLMVGSLTKQSTVIGEILSRRQCVDT